MNTDNTCTSRPLNGLEKAVERIIQHGLHEKYPAATLAGMSAAMWEDHPMCPEFRAFLEALQKQVSDLHSELISARSEAATIDGMLKDCQDRLTAREYVQAVRVVNADDLLPDDGVCEMCNIRSNY